MSRWLLTMSKDGDSTISLATPSQFLVILAVKECFLMFRGLPLYFSLCPLSLVLPLGTFDKSLALSFLNLPSKYLCIMNDKIPLQTFFSLAEQSQLSNLFLHVRQLNPFITLVALGWILHYFHVCLVLRCPELSLDSALQVWPHQC